MKSERIHRIFIVDVEGNGFAAPVLGNAREFGAVHLTSLAKFHGLDMSKFTFEKFEEWILEHCPVNSEGEKRAIFVSDNNGFDYMWINHYFQLHLGRNPFGPFSRRIGDFWAGLEMDWEEHSEWKKMRDTPHTHNPVDDAMGNAEALLKMLKIAQARKSAKEITDEHYRVHY